MFKPALIALALLAVATPAWAQSAADAATDVETIGLLAALDGNAAQRVLGGHLGGDVDRALRGLAARRVAAGDELHARAPQPTAATLGIGAIGGNDQRVYANPYAGTDDPQLTTAHLGAAQRTIVASVFNAITARVSECYGDPMHSAERTHDRVVAAVRVDRKGRVLDARVLDGGRYSDSNIDTCLRPALQTLRFPAGVSPSLLRHAWTFRFTAKSFDLR